MNQTRRTNGGGRASSRALCGAVFCAIAGALLPGAAHAQFSSGTEAGTVTHTITLQSTETETLTWQKCQIGRSDANCSSGSADYLDWHAAWAAAFAANPEGDVKEWRMPSQHELYRLYFDGALSPGQPFSANAFPNADTWWHWSGSSYAPDSALAWFVGFNNGSTPTPTLRATTTVCASCVADSVLAF